MSGQHLCQDPVIEPLADTFVHPRSTGGRTAKPRRVFRWSREARELVREYVRTAGPQTTGDRRAAELSQLITKLANITGHPRDACLRFVRQLGVADRNPYQGWTEVEKQRLVELSGRFPLREAARLLHRSYSSARSMLHHLGVTAQMGKDWFTLYVLAEALHMNANGVQRWIDRGWLKARVIRCGEFKRTIITANDFCRFCTNHREQLMGRTINQERLEFIRTFVFPPDHADLLPVRASKKERMAYKEQGRITNSEPIALAS